MWGFLEQGTKEKKEKDPLESPVPVEVVAAAIVAAAEMDGKVTRKGIEKLLKKLTTPKEPDTSTKIGVEPAKRVLQDRSALP